MSTQAERWERCGLLLHLLARADRGALTVAEERLLWAAVDAELADAKAIAAEHDRLAAAMAGSPASAPGGRAETAASPAEEMRAAARGLRDSGQLPAGTAVALAVADWLDEAAESLDRHLPAWTAATPGEPSGVGHGRPEVVTDLAAHHFGRALAVARALAAEASSALGSDGGGAA